MLATAIEATCSLPVLPLTPVPTNWVVITGVFSSGKTTLLNDLQTALPEFGVQPDAAREIIERGLKWCGPNGEKVELNQILRTQRFEDTIFSLMWQRHLEADPSRPYLLDYGLPDVLAFLAGCGLSTDLYQSRAGLFRYSKVFILEPLNYQVDGARDWDPVERQRILQGIMDVYQPFGFTPILVPPGSKDERKQFVLERIK